MQEARRLNAGADPLILKKASDDHSKRLLETASFIDQLQAVMETLPGRLTASESDIFNLTRSLVSVKQGEGSKVDMSSPSKVLDPDPGVVKLRLEIRDNGAYENMPFRAGDTITSITKHEVGAIPRLIGLTQSIEHPDDPSRWFSRNDWVNTSWEFTDGPESGVTLASYEESPGVTRTRFTTVEPHGRYSGDRLFSFDFEGQYSGDKTIAVEDANNFTVSDDYFSTVGYLHISPSVEVEIETELESQLQQVKAGTAFLEIRWNASDPFVAINV
jgi:hypothetical protein